MRVPKIVFAAIAGLVAGLLFIASNVTALHNPQPHQAPVAVAGADPADAQTALNHVQPGGYHVLGARDAADVQRLIRARDAAGGLVLGKGGATVLTASAGGANAARTIQQELTKVAKPLGAASPPKAQDVVPLQAGDPVDVSLQQVVLGTILGGFMMGVLSAQLALNEPLRVRVPLRMLFGAAFGALAGLLVGPLLGVLTGAFLWTWLWLGLAAWVISAVVAALADVGANLGVLVAYLTMLVLGNPSAAANVPVSFLPGFYRVIGPYLPPNAAATGLLGTTYFHANVLRPALVLGGWGLLALITLYAVERTQGRRTPLAYTAAEAAADRHHEPVAEGAGR